MSKHFSNKVQAILERRSSPSIRILMEEEGDKEEEGGLFDMPDKPDEEAVKEEEDEKESDDSKPKSDDDTPDSDVGDDSQEAEDPEQSPEITASEIASDLGRTAKSVKNVDNNISNLKAKHGINSIQDHISTFVESNRSLAPKNIQSYLFEFAKQDLDYIEKNLDSVQNTIDKADSFVKKYGEGEDVPIHKYVEGAVSAFENFENLFSKEEFIIQAVCNLLILNTGSQAEKHIEDFKDEFAKELSKKSIVYDDRVLKNFNFKSAAGAKTTG